MNFLEQRHRLFPILTLEQVEARLNPDHPSCPFFNYVGNRKSVDEALDMIFPAFERKVYCEEQKRYKCDRLCPRRIALLGPASVGKTTFSRLFAQTLELPYCEMVADEIHEPHILFDRLEAAYEAAGGELVSIGEYQGREKYELPPGVLLIDEIGLMRKRVQDGFLKMLESKDALWLFDGLAVDCWRLCIIIATTSPGKLGDAFKTRFDRITLNRHALGELAQIVQHNVPGWEPDWYLQVAKLVPVPREAIRFAEAVSAAAARRQLEIPDAIKLVAERKSIYEGGVSGTAVKVLKLLEKEPEGLSVESLCRSLGMEKEEFANDVKPCLLANEYHPAYMEVDGRHVITAAGRKFLKDNLP